MLRVRSPGLLRNATPLKFNMTTGVRGPLGGGAFAPRMGIAFDSLAAAAALLACAPQAQMNADNSKLCLQLLRKIAYTKATEGASMNKEDIVMRNDKSGLALSFSLLLLLSLSLGLAACGAAGATSDVPSNEVDMGLSNFVQPSRTINVGESIHFVNEQTGVTHIFCLGRKGNCDMSANGPQELTSQGFTIQPGQTQDVRFDAAGVYAITCPIHPNMNLSITVQ